MQNFDFANDDHNTSDIGLSSTSDIEVEFDWDEALQNLEAESLEEEEIKDGNFKITKSPPVCIYQQLKKLHREFKFKRQILPRTRNSSYLLDKLVQRGSFNMVVLTLHPYNKGYSMGICTTDGLICQETRHPYTQDLLLDYIDRQELPTPYLEYWEETFPQLFYSGSVIVKVRDMRYTQEPHVRHVLLKPHTQSIINDVNLIILDNNHDSWMTVEDKISVESAIVNTVKNPLCLDPSITSGIKRLNTFRTKNLLNSNVLRNAVHRNSPLQVSRKRRAEDLTPKPYIEPNKHLINFVPKKKRLQESVRCKTIVSSFKDSEDFVSCRNIDAEFKDASQLARPIILNQDNVDTPKLIEKYILEPDQRFRAGGPNSHMKLEIFERPANAEYLGTLVVGKEPNDNGYKCSFSIGSKATAGRFIEHFTDIVTKEEEGKAVRITHIVPGLPARETCKTAAHDPCPKSQGNIRIQNNGKTFMQIGSNATIGNAQQCSFKNSAKISVQQFQQQTVSGKTVTADCTTEGTQFSSTINSTVLSRKAKTTLVNNLTATINRSVVSKQKIVPRKMTISNSNIRPSISTVTGTTLKIPLSSPSTNHRVQDQVLTHADAGLHSTINVSAISQNIQTLSTATLKGLKPGVLRNVANVHSGTLDSAQSLQTGVGLQTVHLISRPKEKSVTSNGQSTTSSLSLSLPSLSALLADSPLTNTQLLKKSNNSLDSSQ